MESLLQRLPLALMAVLALAGCERASTDGQPVLRVADQLHYVRSAMDPAGEGAPSDYRIEWSNFVGGPAVIAAQTGGSVDLGWMAETPLIYAQAAGSPVKVVAVSRGLARGSSSLALVVAAKSPIRTAADLKGKKVGFLAGTISQYLLVRVLDGAGLKPSDVTPVQAASVSTAVLDRGIVDAMVASEPVLSSAVAAGTLRVLAYAGEPLTPGFGYLVASDAALADPKRARLIGDFVVRLARAKRWQREHVEEAGRATAAAYNVTPKTGALILSRAPTAYVPIDAAIIAQHQKEADTFERLGLVRKHVDARALFDTRFNPVVANVEKVR